MPKKEAWGRQRKEVYYTAWEMPWDVELLLAIFGVQT
jgi:hypothetical protein